ncbi:hypothetical protein [Acidisphaera rubrifaciens]|uniref:hypothetical protein n=1 Tax=Acidisphaera rubrifaciens TaxID=50715 RepID=UPI00066242B8|nr:hypothetical protein [Acidisphaera rubrifaciens]
MEYRRLHVEQDDDTGQADSGRQQPDHAACQREAEIETAKRTTGDTRRDEPRACRRNDGGDHDHLGQPDENPTQSAHAGSSLLSLRQQKATALADVLR